MELGAWCLSRGIINFPMPNEMAVQPILLAVLQAARPIGTPMICYYGHGQPYALEGDRKLSAITPPQMWLVTKGWNDHWLKDTIVVSIACESMKELGPSAMNKGCIAYVGSREPMYVDVADINVNMINDFVETFNIVPKTILSQAHTLGPPSRELNSLINTGLDNFRNTVNKFIGAYRQHNMDYQLISMMEKNLNNYGALTR